MRNHFYKLNKTNAMNQSKPNDQETQTQQPKQNTPIDARDSSRNDERDQRIKDEPDTERLRSERESTMNRDPE